MAKRFEFDTGRNLYAYSVEKLIDLCQDTANTNVAYQCITQGRIEEWLLDIGENKLSELVYKKQKDTNFPTAGTEKEKVDFICNTLSQELNNRKFFKLLDIDKAIEITLKEYEALRAEILQNTSEISQLILLGLAAIFTIASIGLAPLSDFLTVEDTIIDMPLTLQDIGEIDIRMLQPTTNDEQVEAEYTIKGGDFIISNDKDIKEENIKKEIELSELDETTQTAIRKKIGQKNLQNEKLIFVGTSNDIEYFLRITKTTNGQTIEQRGIVPSIIIFNWLIPGLSFYLIYRSLFAIKKNRMIGKYIYHRVEQKLVNLSFLRKQYLELEDNSIDFQYIDPDTNNSDPNHFFTTNNQEIQVTPGNNPRKTNQNNPIDIFVANFKEHLTHISWEHYISQQETKFLDPLDVGLIFVLFALISGVSLVGGTTLLIFNFDINNWFWYDISLNLQSWKLWFGLVIILLGILSIFLNKLIISINDLENKNKIQLIIINSFLSLIFAMIIFYFFKEITTGKDILKFFCLLFIPFIMYIFFILICLEKKNEVDKLANPQNLINQKRNFRTKTIDKIINQMWR